MYFENSTKFERMNRNISQLVIFFLIAIISFSVLGDVRVENKTIEHARSLSSQLKSQSEASGFARIAKEMGPIIDDARGAKMETSRLNILRELIESMRKYTQQRIKSMETGIQENEAALERLYRSQSWDDYNFAQAAFAYWRAWIDLELARRIHNASTKNNALLTALKGFRVASMQMFRPDLVYGGWLGIGYVEMESGHLDRARDIFLRLEEALALAPESPIREAVKLEVRLLNIRTGNVTAIPVNRQIDSSEAKMLRIEAFTLLDDARKTGNNAEGVAQRLNVLINSGRMDQSLLNEMMGYAQEIAAIGLGAWSDLAAAEFRLRHKDYNRAVQKFETFFKKVVLPRGLNIDNYRYRWAVANFKAKHYQSAVSILERLVRRKHLSIEINKAATKLLFAAASARESGTNSAVNRASLRAAAQRLVSKYPSDRDSDVARLVIAQTTSNTEDALNSLAKIKSNPKLRGDVERATYQITTAEFRRKLAQGKTRQAIAFARDGINVFKKLPEKDKTDAGNRAFFIQMRALVDPNPGEVLHSLVSFSKPDNSNRNVDRALLWSQLQLYDRLRPDDKWLECQADKLLELITTLSAQSIPSWQMEVVYPWIAQLDNAVLRLQFARLVHPSAKTDQDMDRRFHGLIVESLIDTENLADAYEAARAFSRAYTNSGDALRLLGQTAELTNNPFEADRAWRMITESALPTTDIWWEGMLNRTRIRTNSTRPLQGCPLLAELKSRTKYLPAAYKIEYELMLNASQC